MLPSHYILFTLPCRKCGAERSLRRRPVKDQESLVGKTWNLKKMVIKCNQCSVEQPEEDYLITKELRDKWYKIVTGDKNG